MADNGDERFKYWAFISYSHADTRWGDWLHKKLESYRVPRSLSGQPSRDGKVPGDFFRFSGIGKNCQSPRISEQT
jgi:hypothetical protein